MNPRPHHRCAQQPLALVVSWAERESGETRALITATSAAILLHTGLLLTQLPPRVQPPPPDLRAEDVPIMIRWLEPAPAPPRALPQVEPPPRVKKIPKPDPTPDEPEPRVLAPEPPLSVPASLTPLPAPAPAQVPALAPGPAPAPPPRAEPEPVRVAPGQGPRILHRVDPLYPAVARLARREGTVVLDAVILKNGRVAQVTVLRSAGAAFDQAALDALRKWRFSSGDHDVLMMLSVNFRLQ